VLTLATFLTAAALSIPVTVHDGPCPDRPDFSAGCYAAATNTIWVEDLVHNGSVFWHERGHAFDAQRMDAGERAAFSCLHALRLDYGDPPRCHKPWAEDDLVEVFADAYANCAMAALPGSDRFSNGADYWPTKRQHLAVCRFINRAAD
jgi:hypothetical protein